MFPDYLEKSHLKERIPLTNLDQLLWPLNNLEKGSFRNRENLQYNKTADSILLSLLIRTNGYDFMDEKERNELLA